MSGAQKVIISLLIATLLGTIFAVVAFMGIFDTIEARFYNPRITQNIRDQVTLDAETTDQYITELEQRFERFLKEGALRRSFLTNQNREDILERERLSNALMETTAGLQSIRCIDSNGKRIHYSTLKEDILRQDAQSIAYKNYGENERDVPYEQIHRATGDSPLIRFDGTFDRILIAYPFFDDLEVYKGTILFTLSSRGLVEHLVQTGRLKIGEDVALIGNPGGLITLFPHNAEQNLSETVQSAWTQGILGPIPLISGTTATRFVLVSVKSPRGFFVGRIVPSQFFEFPWIFKGILLLSFYSTVFLITLIILNLRQDNLSLIYQRLKRLQLALLQEYLEKKQEIDWNRWLQELEQRRDEIRKELTRGLKKKKRKAPDIDALIDKSWDEILSALGAKKEQSPTITWDEKKLQEIFERVLASKLPLYLTGTGAGGTAALQQRVTAPKAPTPLPKKTAPGAYHTADTTGAEPVEELDSLEELPDADSETEPEALESIEEVAPIEEVANLEDTAPIEEVENLEEVPPAEEAESPEEVTPVEEAEGLEEVASVEEVESLEEVAPAEEVEEFPEEGEELREITREEGKIAKLAPEEEIQKETGDSSLLETVEALESLEEIPELGTLLEPGTESIEGGGTSPFIEEIPLEEDIQATSEASPAEESTSIEGFPKGGEEKHSSLEILEQEPLDTISRSIEFATEKEATSATETDSFSDFPIEVESPFKTLFSDLKIPHAETLESEEDAQTREEPIPEIPPLSEEDLPAAEASTEEEAYLEDLGASFRGDILFSPFLVKPGDVTLLTPAEEEQNGKDGTKRALPEEGQLEELEEAAEVEPLSADPYTQEESQINLSSSPIIEEKEGVSYIAYQLFVDSEPSTNLDPQLKELIDTVLHSPAQKR
ncbi:hypothetical protein [Treponema sp. J25]|uniref:hypothetical protein n=1 Tax=Treponema sp. J25 TaxID=2094121 RepID=UPI00104F2B51|nr:hypothetical protein [Treponema sp. J25]TCW61486.1 hypothetical protein C5O22_06095 [Treponema sp. J25]